jgi:hypothetical protein
MPYAPPQSYDHTLNPVKGWPHPAALDFTAMVDPTTVLYNMRAGQVGHLNAAGNLEPGVQLGQMGLFLFQGVNDYDVNTASGDQWVPITPSGNIACLVASGSYELETTEFVPSFTYNYNDLLHSPIGLASSYEGLTTTSPQQPTTASSGVLRNDSVTLYTTAVVGVLSKVPFTNYNQRQMIGFWTVWCPGTV